MVFEILSINNQISNSAVYLRYWERITFREHSVFLHEMYLKWKVTVNEMLVKDCPLFSVFYNPLHQRLS
jgi:hypothetical protein